MNNESTPSASIEEVELNSYLGIPEVQALCDFLGKDGKEIVATAWRDGFSAGADAIEEAFNRTAFDSYVVLTETSGSYAGDEISVRATLIDQKLYLSEGFNHNEQEVFDPSMLSAESVKKVGAICSTRAGLVAPKDVADDPMEPIFAPDDEDDLPEQ